MNVAKPVRALWCGPGSCGPTCGPKPKDLVACLTPDPCGDCS